MKLQLRTYTINKGQLTQFTHDFNHKIKAAREAVGFKVMGAWTVPATNQFVWIMALEDGLDWDKHDKAYFDSDARKSMQPDPGQVIARMENHFIEEV